MGGAGQDTAFDTADPDFETGRSPAVPLGREGTMGVPSNTACLARWDFLDGDTTVIDNDLLLDCAAAVLEPGQTLWFEFGGAVSPAAADTWRRVMHVVRQVALANAHSSNGQLVADELARLVASTALTCFPHATMHSTTGTPHSDSPASLRRAVAYIEANLDQHINLTDIAAAARVSRRALHLTFTRHHGISPSRYLRRARLDRAHHDLRGAQPGDGRTVTTIATRWGFSSLPRFGVLYRQTYGQPPSHTLRQA